MCCYILPDCQNQWQLLGNWPRVSSQKYPSCMSKHSSVPLTGCVGTVCPASEVVLQQLVSPCWTGSSHQPHCGLVKKHLAETTPKNEKVVSSSHILCFSPSSPLHWILSALLLCLSRLCLKSQIMQHLLYQSSLTIRRLWSVEISIS